MTKFEKLILLSTTTIILLFAATQSSFAQSGYCTEAKVISAGAKTSGIIVYLENTRTDCGNWATGEAGRKWFFIDDSGSSANAMLAAAMSALAMDGSVTVVSKTGDTYTNWGSLVHLSVGN
jgi:hypothetical protein